MEKIRLIVLVDLPSSTRHERKVAHDFEQWLFKDGFVELQAGVYTRLADGRTNAELHAARTRNHRPETGTVRLLALTERQFQNADLLAGEESVQEREVTTELDIFL